MGVFVLLFRFFGCVFGILGFSYFGIFGVLLFLGVLDYCRVFLSFFDVFWPQSEQQGNLLGFQRKMFLCEVSLQVAESPSRSVKANRVEKRKGKTSHHRNK